MCANWVDCREMSPDRNDRYLIDNVGLQIGLGLPLRLLGVSLVGELNMSRQNGGRGRGHSWRHRTRDREVGGIRQTVDGIPIRKLYITNISIEVQRQEMYDIFGCYGLIRSMYLGVSKNDNTKQFAFVTFTDPKDAARVLSQQRFQDMRGRFMYANAADSWHQPREGPNGQIQWKVDRRTKKQEEECEEEEEQVTEVVVSQVEADITKESLNLLNDDCLMHIFSFMSYKEIAAVERVCKRWQALSFRMWRCLHELSFNSHPFSKMDRNTPLLEQYLRRCGESLTMLDLTVNNHAFNETTIVTIAKYCTNLEILRVANINLGNRSLAHLGRRCPKLRQLVMDGCTTCSDKDLLSLLPKCPDLSVLDLSHIDDITGKFLAKVQGPVACLKLNNLMNIEAQYLIPGLENISNTLKNLTLSACGNLRTTAEVDRIVSTVPNLTSFSLCRCMLQFDNNSLSSIGKLSKLTSLNLHLNSAVNDTALAAIVEGCNHLTKLNLSGSGGGCAGVLSERGLSLLAHLRKLTDLDISYLEATNNMSLKNITARNSRLRHLKCRGCPELTDEGTVLIVTNCNDLEVLDLSGCQQVGEKTVETAITSVKMRTNNLPLKIVLGGTKVDTVTFDKDVPLLTIDLADHSEDHLRPDFIDDMFFPPSDSDDEEDLDHLCERIAFMFGVGKVLSDMEHLTDSDDYDSDLDYFPSWAI